MAWRKRFAAIMVLCLIFSVFSASNRFANVSEASDTYVFDLSHDNPTSWGFTLGTKDEIKRWQTFTALHDGSLQQIGLLLREKFGEGTLTPLIVELYATEDGKPTGSPLRTVSVPPEEVVFGEELKVALSYDGLIRGTQYAVSLTQETLSDNGGLHNYSWPTREVNAGETFGKYAAGGWVDESFLGDGCMKVYASYERSASVPTTITLSPKYLNVSPGETAELQVSVADQYGTAMNDVPLVWSSDDVTVAEVVYGRVTAVGAGTATVTASVDGGLFAETVVTVSDEEGVVPVPGMVITENTVLKPGLYDFSSGEGITIGADGIVLDGNGAVLIGPGSLEQGAASFKGTGIRSDGHSDVTVKNVAVKGFQTGMHVKNGSGFTITGNRLSDNYTNPDYGWGDGEMFSALLMESVHDSLIENNRGNNVWNGLHMRHSDHNTIRNNDFSRTSNVSLKMWNASGNVISDNNFSYGIRIAPGEVHARDSTSMLMESGSNDNRLYRNDFTHGGDGIFIRVLNGWVSTGNYFEENDTSYANNNAIESWSPGNTYVRNIANYSSYGFWLGGSDHTVLIGNTVRYNGGYGGVGRNNAPEAFGNAGIAVVNGASSHFVMKDNDIQYNNGPGVAIRYNEDYPAYHWVIQNNTIKNNKNDPRGYKGYGIYIKNAKWLDIAGNDISDNDAEPISVDTGVSDVFMREASMTDEEPVAHMSVSSPTVAVGQPIVFDASGSADPQGLMLHYRWDLGDGTIEGEEAVTHTFEKPGFYRVGVTVNNGKLAELAFADVYVHDARPETGTEHGTSEWELISSDPAAQLGFDEVNRVQGGSSVYVSARDGGNHTLVYPRKKDWNADLTNVDTMSFWLKYNAEHSSDSNNKKPVVRLHQDASNYYEFTPSTAFLEQLLAPVSEQRYGWKEIRFALGGEDDVWSRAAVGSPSMSHIQYIAIVEGPSSGGRSDFWLDGLQLYKADRRVDRSVNMARNAALETDEYPRPIGTPSDPQKPESGLWAPLKGTFEFKGSSTPRWIPVLDGASSEEIWYGVEFSSPRIIDRADVYFYHNPSGTPSTDTEWKPDLFRIEYWTGKHWKPVKPADGGGAVKPNRNTVRFSSVETAKLRVVITPHRSEQRVLAPSIYGFAAYHSANVAGSAFGDSDTYITAVSSASQPVNLKKIGLWINRKGTNLSDPLFEIYEASDGKPAGEPLAIVSIPKEEVKAGAETVVDVNVGGLTPGKQYAVAFTQTVLAPDGSGDHWRWPTRSIGLNERFGKYARSSWVDESFLGTGWLKLYTDNGTIDYSHPNPSGGGYGVGHLDEAKRWQTFTLPDDNVWETIDGSIQDGNGWVSGEAGNNGEAWVELRFAEMQTLNSANIYVGENEEEGIALPKELRLQYWNGEGWQDIKETGPKVRIIQEGFHHYRFQQVRSDRFRILVPLDGSQQAEIREIELYNSKTSGDVNI
ncbi:right-handed parallel beta-helix repeat-containing protein [Paenibacillus thermotolerans]|uniref:right-handed parallel beta-helix repeat-containing protein n=1 Tax=Paenibacillus thermotolerans TaxID=3027807 RepID=UPI002367CDF1|nr:MULTISPECIES: right-handed parallel beta-helix repeat-containing protein [unclassified Paenibacillus]